MDRQYFLKTDRLGFSKWSDEDLDLACQLWGNPEVTQFICASGRFTPKDVENRLHAEIRNDSIYHIQYWPLFVRTTGAFIGCCGLKPHERKEYEMGFHLLPDYWGQGYAQEAAAAVMEYAFTVLHAEKIVVGHNPNNIRSQKLLLRLGFTYIGDEFYEPTGLFHPSYEIRNPSLCRSWSEGDPLLEDYHDHEWCKINHDDDFQFEMLCLEGASVGLSWATIMHKRDAYREAFHGFEIDACADMTDEELESQLNNPGIIRNRNKIYSVRKNAKAVQRIQKEFGSFDAYLWSFVGGEQMDGQWETPSDVPTFSDVSIAMSKDMKKRGISFVGPVITHSFLQSIGIVNDHLESCAYR